MIYYRSEVIYRLAGRYRKAVRQVQDGRQVRTESEQGSGSVPVACRQKHIETVTIWQEVTGKWLVKYLQG